MFTNPAISARIRKSSLIIFLIFYLISPSLFSQQNQESRSEYLPDLDGIIKTKVEFDLNNSLMRFEVRNARFGAKGKINNYMSYKVELDLSDEGKMKMLDAYVKFTPLQNLDIYLGQRKIPFSTDYMRNPAENIFANRSFLAKYINDGMRDIGFYVDYKINTSIPVDILLGAVNGTGNNNPKWIEKPNLVSRLIVGMEKGFRAAGNLYYGEAEYKDHLAMLGGELRFTNGKIFIESEYISRNWTDTLSARVHDDGMYIHSYYNFMLDKKMIKMISPTARFDMIGNSVLGNDIDASRLTFGVNVGFEQKPFYSEIRLNYENYLKSSLPVHTDKLTLEFIARF
ncbi:MAG: porin [Bacteroidia bacterium]|nr:porin [Bacteroidia bacterium]